VFWLQNHQLISRFWDRYAELYEAAHDDRLAPGERRMLVLNVRVADTHEKAWASARAGHDEFWKFLGPYGWSRGYLGPDGEPSPPGLIPTLEESVEQRVWVIGTPEEVAEGIARYRDELGLQDLVIFPGYPGDRYDACEEQLTRFAEDVAPLLGSPLAPPSARAAAR
jgi:alkanesulfonate monooxygenase SsuD/methylene tetrahydromethanopterin reductase-like flavin-dependent oxidoreductase (luciferase family)